MKSFLKKIKHILKNVYLDLYILFIISSIFLYGVLLSINILDLKYIIPITMILIFFNIFFLLIAKSKKLKKKIKVGFSVLSTIISIIFIITSVILLNIFSSVKGMFSNETFVNYSVIVNKESSYKKIKEIDNKIIGFYRDDSYHDKAKDKLLEKTDIKAEFVGYSSLEELENSLINNEIDAMLIMDSYLDVINGDLDEETINEDNSIKNNSDKIDDFNKLTRVIYTFKIKVDNSKKSKKIDLEHGSFAIYVSGQDSYASTVSDASRSDVNLLMVVNLKSKQILLVSIPRDYYINISGKNGYDKLTHISIYGAMSAAESIGELLDIDVEYFVKFNFTTFMKAVEYMLPIDVYSDYTFTTSVYDHTIGDCYTFTKGFNRITSGPMALQFVRARKNFAQGDRQRGINQSRFLRAVINKATTPSVLLKYNDILKALNGTFLTNISDESINEIIKYVISNNGKFNISSYSLDGSDAHRSTYSGGSQALYVMIPNNESIENAKIYIKNILDGDIPNIEKDASELADPTKTNSVTKSEYKEPAVIKPNPTPTPPAVDEKDSTTEEKNDSDNENNNSNEDEDKEEDKEEDKDNNNNNENNNTGDNENDTENDNIPENKPENEENNNS